MGRFSERDGYKQVSDVLQMGSMDEPLMNALWNVLYEQVWSNIRPNSIGHLRLSAPANDDIATLVRRLWGTHFNERLDALPDDWAKVYPNLRGRFYEAPWYEAYDLLEAIAELHPANGFDIGLRHWLNVVLERYRAGYRMVDKLIVPITDSIELGGVQQALDESPGPVKTHLANALDKLSDRENPDYRNSVKESISAVEAFVQQTVGARGSLGGLLSKLQGDMHPALKQAFNTLYGYTSDGEGIRHALSGDSDVDFAEAKFFLVACSAFINYARLKLAAS